MDVIRSLKLRTNLPPVWVKCKLCKLPLWPPSLLFFLIIDILRIYIVYGNLRELMNKRQLKQQNILLLINIVNIITTSGNIHSPWSRKTSSCAMGNHSHSQEKDLGRQRKLFCISPCHHSYQNLLQPPYHHYPWSTHFHIHFLISIDKYLKCCLSSYCKSWE